LRATDRYGDVAEHLFQIHIENVNVAPSLQSPPTDQKTGEGLNFRYSLPADAFKDDDVGDVLTLSASLADGTALPSWLRFDAATATFSGTPGAGAAGALPLLVTATDGDGAKVQARFTLTVVSEFSFTGTPGADVLSGTLIRDVMFGLDGNDTLNGLDGDDTLYGMAGDDSLSGAAGDDVIGAGTATTSSSGASAWTTLTV